MERVDWPETRLRRQVERQRPSDTMMGESTPPTQGRGSRPWHPKCGPRHSACLGKETEVTDAVYPQDEPFTIRGRWWLPGSNQRIAGDLVYEEEGLTLNLYGGLNEARATFPFSATPEETEFPVIHGESLDRVPVTLLDSFYTKWKPAIRSFGIRTGTRTELLSSRLCGNGMVNGIHLRSPDDQFTKCRVEIPYLENWLGDSPFAVDNQGSFEKIHVDYSRPANEVF